MPPPYKTIIPGDWIRLRDVIEDIYRILNVDTTLSDFLADSIAGTSNQVIVTDDGDGTITLSTPQDIHTAASPTFAGMTLKTAHPSLVLESTDTGHSDGELLSTINFFTNDSSRQGVSGQIKAEADGTAGSTDLVLSAYRSDDLKEFLRLSNNGVAIRNAALSVGPETTTGKFEVATAATPEECYFTHYDTGNSSNMFFTFRKSASDTLGTVAETASGDVLGTMAWQGVNTQSLFDFGAQVQVTQTAASDANDVPSKMALAAWGNSGVAMQLVVHGTDAAAYLGVDGGATNYMQIESNGSVVFVGTAGLAFAEIYAHDAADTLAIAASGVANKVQITTFDTNGESNNMTPDHTNDHITVDKPGMYLCTVSLSALSAAGAGYELGVSLWKNNGDTQFDNVHAHRDLAGGGGDTGSITLSGIVDLAASDTMEIWVWNETNTTDVVIEDITLSLVQIGGT
jgi:hypothetical protein